MGYEGGNTLMWAAFAAIKKFSLYSLWGWMGGRHFLLAAFFAGTAFYLAKNGLLTKEYAGAMCAIQGFMTWRTTHEDKKEVAMANGHHDDDDNNDNGQGSAGDKG
jgi:hypothetical protein